MSDDMVIGNWYCIKCLVGTMSLYGKIIGPAYKILVLRAGSQMQITLTLPNSSPDN